MAGISVTLEGNNIQLAFQKGDQSTAVVMDAQAARSLVKAVDQLLTVIGEARESDTGSMQDMLDVTSPGVEVGTDENGQAVLSLQAGTLPAFMLRLKDDEARHIAHSLLEILASPGDIRASIGGH
jgi:hypothetical protein